VGLEGPSFAPAPVLDMGYEGDNEWGCLSNIEIDDEGVEEQVSADEEQEGEGWI
jgi:hypothetical protein